MFEINQDVVYVKGAKNAAIYDFNSGNVYAINHDGALIIEKVILGKERIDSPVIQQYIDSLKEHRLISDSFVPKKYIVPDKREIKFDFVWLELTGACNMRCVHCYEGQQHKVSSNELSVDDWKKVLDDLANVGCPSIIFIGGEPCLNSSLPELINYAHDLKFDHITVFTNATLISDEIIDLMSKFDIKARVSIYGHNAETHDKITTKKGSFDKTVSNIKKMLARGIEISPAVTIMKENENYVNEIKSFLTSLGLTYKSYDVIRNVYCGCQSEHAPILKEVLLPVYRHKPDFNISKDKFIASYNKNTCWYGKMAIDPCGNVYPCEFERNICYGNVLAEGVQGIISSEKLHNYWFLNFSHINLCKDCEFRFACKDCRPLGISICGDLHEKNPRCLYDPYSGIWESL